MPKRYYYDEDYDENNFGKRIGRFLLWVALVITIPTFLVYVLSLRLSSDTVAFALGALIAGGVALGCVAIAAFVAVRVLLLKHERDLLRSQSPRYPQPQMMLPPVVLQVPQLPSPQYGTPPYAADPQPTRAWRTMGEE